MFRNFRTHQNHILSHRPSRPQRNDTDYPVQFEEPIGDADPVDFEESVCLPNADTIQSFSSRWILKTSETRTLTRDATVGIVEDVADLVTYVSKCLLSETKSILEDNEINSELVLSKLRDLFSSHITKPFDGLSSFSNQLQYYRKNFGLIVSSCQLHKLIHWIII